jgi:hypothetical protein
MKLSKEQCVFKTMVTFELLSERVVVQVLVCRKRLSSGTPLDVKGFIFSQGDFK